MAKTKSKNKDKRETHYISAEERQAAKAKRDSKRKKRASSNSSDSAASVSESRTESRRKKKPRKSSKFSKLSKQQQIIVIAVILIIGIIIFSYAKNIVSLTIENRKLRTQQEKLTEERDRLKSTLKNVDSDDYIEEQARKQLRLMNPDEILFIFDEEGKDNAKN